jgi:hypothetical protein
VKAPTEVPELLAAAAGPSTGEKGAEQFGSQEHPFEWGDEQIWPGLTETQRAAVVELLEEYRGIFAWSIYDLRDTAVEGVEFEVNFTDDKVIFAPRRRLSPYEYDLLKAYCEERVAAGLICKLKLPPGVNHPFVAQTVMPNKEGRQRELDGAARLRGLPATQRQDSAGQVPDANCRRAVRRSGGERPLLHAGPQDGVPPDPDQGGGPVQAGVLGPRRHLHAPAHPLRSQERAGAVPAADGRGPLGTAGTGAGVHRNTIVHTKVFQAHLAALRAVFEKLRLYNIKVHPKKICILFPEIAFLWHMVNPIGLKPQEVKVAAIMRIPYPTSVTALKQLMGIINYYRKFLKGCSMIARPLNDLLKKDVDFPAELSTEHKAAIDRLKEMLCSAPLLVRPDPNREFELHTDWSAAGCGAILQQRGEAGEERVISYASRSNNKPKSNYSSYAGECFAAVWGVRYRRVYLYGRKFLLYTDHRPLEWLMTS